MLKHISKHGFYLLECDQCKRKETINATGKTEQQAKAVATRWGWAFDTEHGDLCKRCARLLERDKE